MRWILNLLYYTYIIILPYCYIKIYTFRKKMVVPGIGPSQKKIQKKRKQKNIVTFSYNMTIWLTETLSIGLVVVDLQQTFNLNSAEVDVFLVLLYFLVTCGVSPCLYLVGMR